MIRFAGRAMLASYFIVNGAKSVANPSPLVADAQPLVEQAVPTIKNFLPPQYARLVPNDAKTMVRVNGAAQALGGLGLMTGIGRRAGAGLVALSMLPHVAASKPLRGASPEEKKANRANTMRNVALLGGALMASQDTAGKPGLAWRTENFTNRLLNAAEKQKRALTKDSRSLQRDAGKTLNDLQQRIAGMLPG